MKDRAVATAELVQELRSALGNVWVLTDPSDTGPYCEDWRGLYRGRTPAVLRPASTAQVAEALRLCAKYKAPVVPQGGNTSMVGGATVSNDGSQLVLNLSRLNRVHSIDAVDMTMEVEAGVTLKAAQDAAIDAGCMLPLSISAEGTAQIGGVLAVNAGGNNTVRYGNARDLVLGLEVVLADGQVWNGLRRLRKDNTGYCLRQLFVGSEGTLGIITSAVLKLVPRPRQVEVALCGVQSPNAALDLFSRLREQDPDAILAFEYMSGTGMELVLKNIPGTVRPLSSPAPNYVLIELGSVRTGTDLRAEMEQLLYDAYESNLISDAVVAESASQRTAIWRLREEHSEAQKREGASIKNDVSVPVSCTPDLIRRATVACQEIIPGIRAVPFGHIGDGNIHFNLVQPEETSGDAFLARSDAITSAVNNIVRALDGSFSAEHGVGRLKPHMMSDWRGGAELDMMRKVKRALDPNALLNPGKLLPD